MHTPGSRKLKALTEQLLPAPAAGDSTAEQPDRYERKKELIATRYYYYLCQGKQYDEALVILEAEFFLSPKQIANIIAGEFELLKRLRDEKKDKSWFKINWSHIVW